MTAEGVEAEESPESGDEMFGFSFSDEDEASAVDESVVVQPPDDFETEGAVEEPAEETEVEDSTMTASVALTDEDVERIARRVVELIGDQTVREISWDVIPDLAEIVIKDRIRELESQVE